MLKLAFLLIFFQSTDRHKHNYTHTHTHTHTHRSAERDRDKDRNRQRDAEQIKPILVSLKSSVQTSFSILYYPIQASKYILETVP